MLVRRRSLHHVLLGTALTVAACTKPKGDGVVAPDGGGGGPVTTEPGALVELAPVDHPSQLMPRGTAVLVTATSMNRVAEALERDHLVATFGPQYTSLRSMIVGSLGHDLLDPKAWPELGLDPGGTVGLGVSDLAEPRLVLFATVSDRRKLVDLVRKLAGQVQMEVVEETYGDALLLRPKGDDDDGAIVLRDRLVAITLDTGGKGPLDLAKRMVAMDPNVSLASEAAYRNATGGLRAADVALYLDVAGMVDQAYAKPRENPLRGYVAGSTDVLEEARKRNAPPHELEEYERNLADAKAQEERWSRSIVGQQALAELLVSGIEGIGLTATVESSGPVFDGRVVAKPEAFLRRLLANRSGVSPLPTAMNGAPLWCSLGRFDPTAAIELAEAMVMASGVDPIPTWAGVKEVLGLDVKTDLVPMLGGDVDVCLAVEGELSGDPEKALRMGAAIQMTDAAKAKHALAELATSGGRLRTSMKKRGEGYTVTWAPWGTVHLQTAGDRVVVSTDPELAKRLAAGNPGAMPSKIRPPAAMGAMGRQGTATSQVLDLSLAMLWAMVDRSSPYVPPVVVPGLTSKELEKVPLSAKSKKAKKAMEKARVEVDAFGAKRDALEVKLVLSVTDGLGMMIAAATEDDRGFTLTGGQFLRAEGLGHVLEAFLQAASDRRSGRELEPAEQARAMKAWDRWEALRQAYADARMEDGKKHLDERGKAPAPVPEIAPAPER